MLTIGGQDQLLAESDFDFWSAEDPGDWTGLRVGAGGSPELGDPLLRTDRHLPATGSDSNHQENQTMQLTRTTKVLLGAATAWPFVYVFLAIAMVLTIMAKAADGGGPPLPVFGSIVVLHVLTMLDVIGLLVFYVIHAIKNDHLDQNTRLLWAILLFVGNIIAMLIYYFLHVWPTHAGPGGRAGAAGGAASQR